MNRRPCHLAFAFLFFSLPPLFIDTSFAAQYDFATIKTMRTHGSSDLPRPRSIASHTACLRCRRLSRRRILGSPRQTRPVISTTSNPSPRPTWKAVVPARKA